MSEAEAQTPTEGAGLETKEPTIEELQAQVKEKEGMIKGLNRSNTKITQQLRAATSTGEAVAARMQGIEDSLANMTDAQRVADGEEAIAVKALTASRQKADEASKVDPELARLMEDVDDSELIVDFENLGDPNLTSPIITEAFKGTQNASEARKALRKALKAKRDTDTQEKITVGIQQGLKENGVTVKGAQASTSHNANITRENLKSVNMENAHIYAEHEKEFDAAIAAKTLK